ncbi:SH3 domain-containing protein [Histidinibacterium aquaticum]|uniref:SH3 domain-containing protein n=1 Tax=Histidinibacterium aquaticum TaxID=2613962 RepID=A0A5J5GMP6_9RHOB|nr:SH3 domain-containing protein [Histidinibacterium aquaticum]KAA9008878.1 SH3 domain-containing protein [Histidinibacterium aquaticum]
MFKVSAAPIALLSLMIPAMALAQADGHGPDAWQVSGVASNDALNVRTGPGTDHIVIDTFAHDATGLQMITCVPFVPAQLYYRLTEDQKADLPPRWCLMESSDRATKGWVSAHFLEEDTSPVQANGDPLIAEAVALVRKVYEQERTGTSASSIGPLHPSVARSYFFPDVVERLRQGDLGAHPLFGTQDADISNLEVFPAPERAMFRSMFTVHATFRNYGQPQTAVFRLMHDTSLEDPAIRIMRIEHDGWTFP